MFRSHSVLGHSVLGTTCTWFCTWSRVCLVLCCCGVAQKHTEDMRGHLHAGAIQGHQRQAGGEGDAAFPRCWTARRSRIRLSHWTPLLPRIELHYPRGSQTDGLRVSVAKRSQERLPYCLALWPPSPSSTRLPRPGPGERGGSTGPCGRTAQPTQGTVMCRMSASHMAVLIRWSRVLLNHMLDAARSY